MVSSIPLPTRLTYRVTAGAMKAQMEVAQGKSSWSYWDGVDCTFLMTGGGGFVIGLTSAVAAGQYLTAVLLLVITAWLLVTLRKGERNWRAHFEHSLVSDEDYSISLLIDEDGFREEARGVTGICPWGSMVRFGIRSDTLCVELTNALWAIIPSETLAPADISIESIAALLAEKGVCRRDLPSLTAA